MAVGICAVFHVVFAFFSPFFCDFGGLKPRVDWWWKELAIYRHRTLVIGIRIVHILTADRRDDGHICRVRASMSTASLSDGEERPVMDDNRFLFSVLVTSVGDV